MVLSSFSYNTGTPSFKQFLYTLTSGIKCHQPIAFYYDLVSIIIRI